MLIRISSVDTNRATEKKTPIWLDTGTAEGGERLLHGTPCSSQFDSAQPNVGCARDHNHLTMITRHAAPNAGFNINTPSQPLVLTQGELERARKLLRKLEQLREQLVKVLAAQKDK